MLKTKVPKNKKVVVFYFLHVWLLWLFCLFQRVRWGKFCLYSLSMEEWMGHPHDLHGLSKSYRKKDHQIVNHANLFNSVTSCFGSKKSIKSSRELLMCSF